MKTDIIIMGWGTTSLPVFSADLKNLLNSVQEIYVKSSEPILALNSIKTKYITPQIEIENGVTDAYQLLAESLINAAPTVYLVPGDPLIDEGATPVIKEMATQANLTVGLIQAEDLLTPALRTFQLSPGNGLQILDATLLCSYYSPPLEPHRPALISGLYHPDLLELSKRKLQSIYGCQSPVFMITSAGRVEIKLDRLDKSYTGFLYLPPQQHSAGLTAFQNTIAHLRAPNGCPWDREQTHQSLRPYLLEETYEALTALDEGDSEELSYELGDVLLQIALHAQIGAEAGTFQMNDIIQRINQKIIRRHPHVFGNVEVSGSDEVTANWAIIKAQEKAEKGEATKTASILDGIPPALPALAQALHISQRAVKVGFEWDSIDGVLEKLVEEAHEIAAAANQAEVESEIGDLLFVAVNVARKLKVDPETALRGSNARFSKRFKAVEALAREKNLSLTELDVSTWQTFWGQAKQMTG